MNISKKNMVVSTCVLLAVAGIAWFVSKGSSAGTPDGPGKKKMVPLVTVEEVRSGEIAELLQVTGEVVAADTVVIAVSKEGPVAYCPWREGDTVKAGEKLIEINREVFRAEVRASEAALSVAQAKLADLKAGARSEEVGRAKANLQKWKATLEEARKNYERQKQLISKDFTSQQSVDKARERAEVAEAELAVARENLRMLKTGPTETEIAVQTAIAEEAGARLELAGSHLSESVVTAPFNGRITAVHVRPGDLATPRSPLIEMFDPDTLVVRFSVPEAYAEAMEPGLAVEAQMDAIAGETFQGKIDRVYPQLDPDMRTRTVEARLEESMQLMPHQFARITVILESASDAVIVPAEAVHETPDGRKIAYVVKDGKTVRRIVEKGIQQAQRVQIVKGIKAGEQVVVVGNEKLKHGASVRVTGAGRKEQSSGSTRNKDISPGSQGSSGGGQK